MKPIFNDYQKKLSDIILENNALSPLSELYSNEIRELAVVWSYYSGKIEGNTYSFVETETLLKDGITSAKKFEDAKMLKNLYNTFIAELQHIKSGNKEVIDKRFLMQMHSQLLDELVDDRERGIIRKRALRIAGSDYVPLASPTAIEESLDHIITQQANLSNPLERAVYLHCNIAKLQPFIDGNKRTARLTESVVLMNEDIIPIFSTNNIDINGVQLTLKKADNVVNKVSISADKDAIYDKIKEFVEGYNKIVKSMQDKVKEKAFRSYEPLTDTERKALSETEVKLWDEKAKSGLLNSDNTVSNILSNVRSGLYEKVEGAGSLFELGITTGTYQNGAVLQIDEKKLKNAIAKDPQKVLDTLFKSPDDIKDHPKNSVEGKAQRANTGVFVRVMEDMSNGITAIAKQSGVGNESSILQQVKGNILSGVVKNSSILEKSLSELTKRIDDENRKVEIFENNLWKKFSAMESAIQKMQSQTSWMNQQS